MQVCLVLALLGLMSATMARADVVCTLIVEVATGSVLREDGDCETRVTPASTFKIPLAVMGFAAGVLQDAETPVMHWQPGDPDWGGAAWVQPTGPASWMQHSVVWYSQRITRALGAGALTAYARGFGYGTADFSGDAGFDNGLERAWIASSLLVSPREQAGFLRALLLENLPVAADAMAQARGLVERQDVGAWEIRGKTGTAYPRRADRSFDRARGWGWYVGWAERDGRVLVFVRLTQGGAPAGLSGGVATRDAFLREWPDLAR